MYERHVGHIDRVTDSHRPFVYMKGNRCIIGGGEEGARGGKGGLNLEIERGVSAENENGACTAVDPNYYVRLLF